MNNNMTTTQPLFQQPMQNLVNPELLQPNSTMTEIQTVLAVIADLQRKQLAVLNQQVEALLAIEKQLLTCDEKLEAKQVVHTKTAEQFKTLAGVLAHYQEQFHALVKSSF